MSRPNIVADRRSLAAEAAKRYETTASQLQIRPSCRALAARKAETRRLGALLERLSPDSGTGGMTVQLEYIWLIRQRDRLWRVVSW